MAKIAVYWTTTAVKQRNYVFEYWNARNKSTAYAIKLNATIKERLNLLKQYPELGKLVGISNFRAIYISNFSLLYLYETDRIVVVAFWDNRQDPDVLLDYLQKF